MRISPLKPKNGLSGPPAGLRNEPTSRHQAKPHLDRPCRQFGEPSLAGGLASTTFQLRYTGEDARAYTGEDARAWMD